MMLTKAHLDATVSVRYISQYLQETEPEFRSVSTEALANRIRYVIESKKRYSPEPSKILDALISAITRTANQRQASPKSVVTVKPNEHIPMERTPKEQRGHQALVGSSLRCST
jgi:hypothetical protein